LVPCLTHNGIKIWDTLAIAEYLNEIKPKAACCRRTAPLALAAARSAGRCIPGSAICDRRCR
jgi:glutathione S-transferase